MYSNHKVYENGIGCSLLNRARSRWWTMFGLLTTLFNYILYSIKYDSNMIADNEEERV
jgi:hypothetical protein